MIHIINGASKNNLIIQPVRPSPDRVEFSDTGFPLLKNKIPQSQSEHSSSLRRGPLYLINLKTSSLL